MTRDEKLQALASVLLTAAEKARQLSESGGQDGFLSRECALAMQLESIAREFNELATQGESGAPA